MGKKDANKPRGRMSAYVYFVQNCREEHKKTNPGESVVFTEFSKECSAKWKVITPKDKKMFEEMAKKDKVRYDREMKTYVPVGDDITSKGRKRKTKDPNAPKRPTTGFFFFCQDERPAIRAANPSWTIGLVAKELGRKWETCKTKPKYDSLAKKDKLRYEKEMAAYNAGEAKKAKSSTKSVAAAVESSGEEEEDDEEDDDEEEEEEDDE